jgi:hypothetical protein
MFCGEKYHAIILEQSYLYFLRGFYQMDRLKH